LFVIGVIAGDSLNELQPVESVATETLLVRLGGLVGGAKRWDGYLVLLTSQSWTTLDSRDRMELVYNTRGIRRVIGADVVADEEGDVEAAVGRALRPFLPLANPIHAHLADLDDSLVRALAVNGVELEDAERYVAAYRAQGSLDGV
jgi:hypothetical protein